MRMHVESPIGPLGIETEGEVVVGVRFGSSLGPPATHPVAAELADYFAG